MDTTDRNPYGHENIPLAQQIGRKIIPTEHKGESVMALWRHQQFDTIRVRLVEYSPGYCADHWAEKVTFFYAGGELHTELRMEESSRLTSVSYQVADDAKRTAPTPSRCEAIHC